MATAADSATAGAARAANALTPGRLWRWWRGELAACAPAGLRAATRFLNESTFVELGGGRAQAWRHAQGRMQALEALELAALPAAEQPIALKAWLGRVAPESERVVLLAGAASVVSKTISLPQATEENLRQVLAFELDRHTPFKAEDAYFDCRVLRRALDDAQISVQLAVAPRARIDPALALLTQAGVRPAAVVPADDLSAERMPLDLLPPERRPQGASGPLNRRDSLLAALAIALCLLALGLPIWQKREALAALGPQVEQARRAAAGAESVRNELDRLLADYNFPVERKLAYPPAVVVLDELTRLLPDGTWLQQFALRSHPSGWEVQIQGETTVSSKLVGILDASPMFGEASFKSPLVKGQAAGSERFDLVMELAPAPAAGAGRVAGKSPPAAQAAAAAGVRP